jgi:hypothetical protein
LALSLAYELRSLFPGGAIYVSLRASTGRPKPSDGVITEMLTALGVGTPLPAPLTDRSALLRGALRSGVLVLVDDVPDAQSVRPLLPGPGRSLAVIASRPQLHELDMTWHHTLGPLTTPDGVALLREVVGSTAIDADPQAAERIVLACGGLPLALRIVATRLATTPGIPLRAVAGRLESDVGGLDEIAADDTSLRERLGQSYWNLDTTARHVLRQLGRLPGAGFSEATAVKLTGMPLPYVSRVLERLSKNNVVTSMRGPDDSPVYEIAPLMKAFARERALHGGATGKSCNTGSAY